MEGLKISVAFVTELRDGIFFFLKAEGWVMLMITILFVVYEATVSVDCESKAKTFVKAVSLDERECVVHQWQSIIKTE